MATSAIPANIAVAPPDWTPQPSGATPMDLNSIMGGAPQLPSPTQPNVQDPSVIPSYAPTPPTAPITDPEIVAGHAHQNWLGHIMDVVGSILGGDQTIHITKSPDGTMTVDHDPSTGGEKWGRVARAALMGAASGMANGQGPGGPARAFASGVGTGAAQGPKDLAAANAQAATMNKQQLDAANMALLHQKIFQATWETQHQPLDWAQTQAERYVNFAAKMNEMGATPVATDLRNSGDVATYGTANKLATDAHMGQGGNQLYTYPNGNGGVAAWTLPTSTANQMYDKPWTWSVDVLDKDHPGQIITKEHTTDPNQMTKGEQAKRELALVVQNNATRAQAATITKGITEKIPTTGEGATIAGSLETDPVKRAALLGAGQTIAQREINKAVAGRAAAAQGTPEDYNVMGRDLNLGRLDLSQLRTRRDWPQIYDAAVQYATANALQPFDPATASAKYKARVQTINDFTNKKEADQIQSVNNFFGHAQDLMDVTQSLRNPTGFPILNDPINKLTTDFAGDPRLSLLLPKIAVVRKEYQAFLENNRALHNEDITAGNQMLNDNMTPAMMENAVKAFSQAAVTRAATTAQRAHSGNFDEIIPHILNSNSRRTIANMGLQDHLNKVWQDVGPTSQQQAPPPPTGNTRQIPPGAVAGRDPRTGEIIGYRLNGKVVTF